MGTEKAVLRKIRIGELHGGAFTSSSLTDLYRDTEIYGLPFLFHSYEETTSAPAWITGSRRGCGVRAW